MDFKIFFDTSRAQLRTGKPAQVKLGRVERHRPAGLIHTNTRSPACGGLYWYLILKVTSFWELSLFLPPLSSTPLSPSLPLFPTALKQTVCNFEKSRVALSGKPEVSATVANSARKSTVAAP